MILSLALGKTLDEVRRMPAADYQRYRRFYVRHPFGPLRGDMQAWLAGSIARSAWAKKAVPLGDALAIFDPPRRRRRVRPAKDLHAKLGAWFAARGGLVLRVPDRGQDGPDRVD